MKARYVTLHRAFTGRKTGAVMANEAFAFFPQLFLLTVGLLIKHIEFVRDFRMGMT